MGFGFSFGPGFGFGFVSSDKEEDYARVTPFLQGVAIKEGRCSGSAHKANCPAPNLKGNPTSGLPAHLNRPATMMLLDRVQTLLHRARNLTVLAKLRRRGQASYVHRQRLVLMRQTLATLSVS